MRLATARASEWGAAKLRSNRNRDDRDRAGLPARLAFFSTKKYLCLQLVVRKQVGNEGDGETQVVAKAAVYQRYLLSCSGYLPSYTRHLVLYITIKCTLGCQLGYQAIPVCRSWQCQQGQSPLLRC